MRTSTASPNREELAMSASREQSAVAYIRSGDNETPAPKPEPTKLEAMAEAPAPKPEAAETEAKAKVVRCQPFFTWLAADLALADGLANDLGVSTSYMQSAVLNAAKDRLASLEVGQAKGLASVVAAGVEERGRTIGVDRSRVIFMINADVWAALASGVNDPLGLIAQNKVDTVIVALMVRQVLSEGVAALIKK